MNGDVYLGTSLLLNGPVVSRSGHLLRHNTTSAYIPSPLFTIHHNEHFEFPRRESGRYTKCYLGQKAYNEQKAIALVQKAIDEDVKQNYAVRSNVTTLSQPLTPQ